MALYPYSVAPSVPQGIQPLAPGTAICIPIVVPPGSGLTIDLVQATGESVQDFTLRAWIGDRPLANPDASLAPFLQTWFAKRSPGLQPYVLYDRALPPPDTIFAIPAAPGSYLLNVLNLTNQPNQFWLTLGPMVATSP